MTTLSVRSPPAIRHRVVEDWDELEALWHHTFFDQMRVAPEEHSQLHTGLGLVGAFW